MSDNLLPCPFCGRQPEIYKAGKWYAECESNEMAGKYGAEHRVEISATGNLVLKADVIAAWNRRSSPRLEALERVAEAARNLDKFADGSFANDGFRQIREERRHALRLALATLDREEKPK